MFAAAYCCCYVCSSPNAPSQVGACPMETRQIIEASADVITITRLRAGDVYKRVETDYQGTASLRFGIVSDVMHNGSDGAFAALEYTTDFSAGVAVTQKVYDGGKPAALYPAT